MKLFFAGFVFLLSLEAQAYKFICNGIDSEGNTESDHCGVCNDVTGPRWIPSTVNVRVDTSIRPQNLSERDWLNVAVSSMNSWNSVAGANIKIQHVGNAVKRSFGSDIANHELFWVTNKTEWRRKVGGGENGALGVTVAPYNCPNPARAGREIYDADLIMNGVGKFNWSSTCTRWGDCESIRSTLTHELGHFIGLGHPCAICSWSIMSAQAGYNIDYPVFDDQEALRALYPGTSSGEIGTRCETNRDCKGGFSCITQEETNYCSRTCSEAEACPDGYACDDFEGRRVCKFAIGRLAGAVGAGESCQTQPCEDGLVCAGDDADHLYCFSMCSSRAPCNNGETCVPLEGGGNEGVCVRVVRLGEKCDHKTMCDSKLLCVMDGDAGRCRQECNPKKSGSCRSGETCHAVGQGKGVCLDGQSTLPNEPSLADDSDSTSVDEGEKEPGIASSCACMALKDKTMSKVGIGFVFAGFLYLKVRRRQKKARS